MDLRPIPAFYCCYLLRSTVHHTSLYVGSTPNPQRRLAQHNGISKGGAMRTARDKLRPWEMACIIMGFPSNIAALQFEWAWQNTHLTKRITDEARITARPTKTKISTKTGRTRRRPARPRVSLSDKLANLHLLLRVPSFARWPLEVRFFCEDVFRVWQRWKDQTEEPINGEILISLDLKQLRTLSANNSVLTDVQPKSKHRIDGLGKGGMEGIDASYQGMKNQVEKSLFLLAEGESVKCAVCDVELGKQRSMALVCPVDGCRMVSHLSCLAKTFIERDAEGGSVLPRAGKCPSCRHILAWVDLVKDLSLRVRGDKDVAQLMKKPRSRNVKAPPSTEVLSAQFISDSNEEEKASVLDEATEEALPDDWHCAEDDDDAMSMTSAASDITDCSGPTLFMQPERKAPRLGPVIEDSDWDEAQVLE